MTPRELKLFGLVAFTWPLLFALLTNWHGEDFLITFRPSQNLCEGKGLVFNEGERVHSFTSPLGVLLPALGYQLTGQRSVNDALWFFRVLSALAFAGGGCLLLSAVKEQVSRPRLVQFLLAGLFLLESKAIGYSMNGMETGFMILFVAWGLYLTVRPPSQFWLWQGTCWAGLMWTRPDGCVYVAVLTLVQFAGCERSRRGQMLRALLGSALVCTVLYLPWFAWAWSYYGSPVPNTVLAKSFSYVDEPAQPLPMRVIERAIAISSPVWFPLHWHSAWYLPLGLLSSSLGLFGVVYAILPHGDRLGRRVAVGLGLLVLYLASLPSVSEWYYPPVALFALFVLARAPVVLAEKCARGPAFAVATAIIALILVEKAAVFGATSWAVHVRQHDVEFGCRRPLALWLKEQAQPNETVYSEPLGYFGYFSQAHMVDWPGLANPQVVRLRREGFTMASIVPVLQPDWLILRPAEVDAMDHDGYLLENYREVKSFNNRPLLEEYAFLPGRNYLMFDAYYCVYHKKEVREASAVETNALKGKKGGT